jgi:hypothetical protein
VACIADLYRYQGPVLLLLAIGGIQRAVLLLYAAACQCLGACVCMSTPRLPGGRWGRGLDFVQCRTCAALTFFHLISAWGKAASLRPRMRCHCAPPSTDSKQSHRLNGLPYRALSGGRGGAIEWWEDTSDCRLPK